MNRNRNTIISLVIIVVTLSIGGLLLLLKNNNFLTGIFRPVDVVSPINFVQLKFGDKSFKLNSLAYPKDSVINVASFDGLEGWRGDENFEDNILWVGDSSLLLESRDNVKKEAYLLKKFDFSKDQFFRLAVYLQTDPADLESVRLYFGNKDKSAYFYYSLTNLAVGWNHLRIARMKFSSAGISDGEKNTATSGGSLNWSNIDRVGIELNSRFNSVAKINVENLVAYQSEDYLDDWLTRSPTFFDLAKTKEGNVVLMAKNVAASTALIKKLSGVSDFTFKAKVQPLKINARSGLFVRGDYNTGYGYYFFIDGVNGNRWQILKYGPVDKVAVMTTLKNGMISNFAVEKDQPLWLKAELKGQSLKFFISMDNKSYTLLGEAVDGEFKEGGVGISVYDGGVTMFDEMEFNQ